MVNVLFQSCTCCLKELYTIGKMSVNASIRIQDMYRNHPVKVSAYYIVALMIKFLHCILMWKMDFGHDPFPGLYDSRLVTRTQVQLESLFW